MAKELVWNERNLKKFWDYWSGKEDAYFAIAFGHIIVEIFSKYILSLVLS